MNIGLSKVALEQIQRDNAQYEAMSPMERRVHISKEIIAMLEAETFVAGDGYGRVLKSAVPLHSEPEGYRLQFPIGDLQPIIRAGGFVCMGCAKAAIIVARASLGNKVHISKDDIMYGADQMAHTISKEVFGNRCAELIEAIYEHWYAANLYHVMEDVDERYAYNTYIDIMPSNEDQRMRAIYQNIIDNNGHLTIGKYRY